MPEFIKKAKNTRPVLANVEPIELISGDESDCEIIEQKIQIINVDAEGESSDSYDDNTSSSDTKTTASSQDNIAVIALNDSNNGESPDGDGTDNSNNDAVQNDSIFFIDTNPVRIDDVPAPIYVSSPGQSAMSCIARTSPEPFPFTHNSESRRPNERSELNQSGANDIICLNRGESQSTVLNKRNGSLTLDGSITSASSDTSRSDSPTNKTNAIHVSSGSLSTNESSVTSNSKVKETELLGQSVPTQFDESDTDDDSVIYVSEIISDSKARSFIPLNRNSSNQAHPKAPNPAKKHTLKQKALVKRLNDVLTLKSGKSLKKTATIDKAINSNQPWGRCMTTQTSNQLVGRPMSTATRTCKNQPSDRPAPSINQRLNKFVPTKQEIEDERKLFQSNPDLFEKRMIIIDGSNIAYAYVNTHFSCFDFLDFFSPNFESSFNDFFIGMNLIVCNCFFFVFALFLLLLTDMD